jgi:deoxyadenosine/deoxycytidine kinase
MTNYSYKDENPINACWNADPDLPAEPRGTYVAISGNTAAGKSTLVGELTRCLRANGKRAIGINERSLHHPLLPLMFYEPTKYALGIQLNFLLQRHLVLYRWLDLGYVVVIERSHFDDRLYMQTHLDQGNISAAEFAAYDQLFETLSRRLPDPDIYIFLDVPVELSLKRLKRAAESGERPEEFPNEESKRIFVSEWQRRFQDQFRLLKSAQENQGRYPTTRFYTWPAETPTRNVVDTLLPILGV